MAFRDYICCGECGEKMIPDGYESGRTMLEEKWGDPNADTWTVSLLCPACIKILRYERDRARAERGRGVQILTRIHSLLYPRPISTEDGMRLFRPRSPDPHETLQMLSDRIRAIPEELSALPSPQPPPSPQVDPSRDGEAGEPPPSGR